MKIQLQKTSIERQSFLFMQLITGTIVLFVIRYIYLSHPYYQSFIQIKTQEVLSFLFWFLLIILWLDAVIKFLFVKKIHETKLVLIFVFVYSLILKLTSKLPTGNKKYEIQWNAKIKTALLSVILKAFYIPIMLNFTIAGYTAIKTDMNSILHNNLILNFNNSYNILITAIFLIDTGIFAFGYIFESKWLHNEIRSVEPTLFGWAIALATYPPFNSLTGQWFPLIKSGTSMYTDQSQFVVRLIMILIVICDLIFVSASIALFTKASNLTNRGIVSRGPYRFVRHPAYTAKLAAWGLSGFLGGINLAYYFYWCIFVVIYGLRAWTEERHLSMDPEYVEYKKKVKYCVLPKII